MHPTTRLILVANLGVRRALIFVDLSARDRRIVILGPKFDGRSAETAIFTLESLFFVVSRRLRVKGQGLKVGLEKRPETFWVFLLVISQRFEILNSIDDFFLHIF